jgi:hypothetical protein
MKECPFYEYDEKFDEHICHAVFGEDECPKEFVYTCKYEPEQDTYEEDDYYGEFGMY